MKRVALGAPFFESGRLSMTRLLLLLATGSALALTPVRLADTRFSYVDLQSKANQKLTDNLGSGREGNNLAAVPKGEQTWEGVKFKIADGFLQLGSQYLKEPKPDRVDGIKIGKAFTKLHLLQGTLWGHNTNVADDTEIAKYQVHYEGGDSETIPVVYGKDVRDWWVSEDAGEVTRGKVAWKGQNSRAGEIRLYLVTWENPHPTKRVVSIDYVKIGGTDAAPFCVAITLEEK